MEGKIEYVIGGSTQTILLMQGEKSSNKVQQEKKDEEHDLIYALATKLENLIDKEHSKLWSPPLSSFTHC